MAHPADCPELSVIVPTLNEAGALPRLLECLAAQQDVNLEVIVGDGGSDDGTPEDALKQARISGMRLLVARETANRGRQMNAAAAVSSSCTLLFLHADSSFEDRFALRAALDVLAERIAVCGHERVAGHFSLRFSRSDASYPLGYYYYERKARLNRRECIHGDQGFLMRRAFFDLAGPYEEALPMLAETRLAEVVRREGEWLLLPGEIGTSARRFETEGFRERQTLNAILMNFAALRWEPFFREFPLIYRRQMDTSRLCLSRLLEGTGSLIKTLPFRQRLSLWYATGAYVRENAWQLAFFLDVLRDFHRGTPAGKGAEQLLDFYDRRIDHLIDNAGARLTTAFLVWLWFQAVRLTARMGEKSLPPVPPGNGGRR